MTKLQQFLADRGPADMYDDCWVPCTLWPFAVGLAEVVNPGDHVLDVGAGTGLLTDLAAARVGARGHVTALDPTPFMQEVLHRKFDGAPRITVVEGTIENANFPDDRFDTLLCHQVVQYVGDLPAAFAAMRRVLKPGGVLAVGVWSGATDQSAAPLEEGFGTHLGEGFAPIHAWSFGGLDRLRTLAEAAGFVIERLETDVRTGRFASIEHLMNVHLAGGMRVVDGDVLMGIFDLADASFEPKVARLLEDLSVALAGYEGPGGLAIPFASDVLVARA
jgi:SAM-dependent methyltransferase